MKQSPARALPLLPLIIFMAIFLGSGLYYQMQGVEFAFYQVKAPVAILPAIVLALLLGRNSLNEKLEVFLKGVGDSGIITMCMVFLLAGAFASVTAAIGGVEATVNFGLSVIPESLVLPGLFVISAFIAMAMGTSVGTIAAVTPIAVGLADASNLSLPLCVGTVIGGAMFGDNLSIISDTTIAATRTQGCEMRDKFRMNALIAAPAAVATIFLLYWLGDPGPIDVPGSYQFILVLPYIAVLVLAVSGLNVLLVLMIGLCLSGFIGLINVADYSLASFSQDIYAGYEKMLEIMVLSMLIGGLSAVMKAQGGLRWLSQKLVSLGRLKGQKSRRSSEVAIGLLVAIAGFFTANNTVAILITGSAAKNIAEEQGIDPRRTASLLDIFSCIAQGVMPYGAQILLAGSIAGLSPMALVGQVYYCWLLLLGVVVTIILNFPKVKSSSTAAVVAPEVSR